MLAFDHGKTESLSKIFLMANNNMLIQVAHLVSPMVRF